MIVTSTVAILAVIKSSSYHLQVAGLGVAGLGAIALIVSGAYGLRALRGGASREAEKLALLIGGILLAIGFLIDAIGIHVR